MAWKLVSKVDISGLVSIESWGLAPLRTPLGRFSSVRRMQVQYFVGSKSLSLGETLAFIQGPSVILCMFVGSYLPLGGGQAILLETDNIYQVVSRPL